MTSTSDTSSLAPPSPRPKKSLSNRFTSLFTSKASHISDLYVELDEPHRHYGPGDNVNGKVVLNVAKPLGVTHIIVRLQGYIQVFKNHNKPRTSHRSSSPRSPGNHGKRWVSEYYGDGYASLFEDEVVLCGEGRLDPKLYHFRFESQFPTDFGLPTSIEFERGCICYRVTATVTRPASLVPTVSVDRRVSYKDRIDVGTLPASKPRVVTLEPIDRSSKAKASLKRLASYSSDKKRHSALSSTSKDARSTRTNTSTSQISYDETASTRPPSPSVASTVSACSGGQRASRQQSEPRSSVSQSPRIQIESPLSRVITASVQLDRCGCLPGESIPLRISIQHVKAIRSLNGIIVTLYRQARVDSHPNLPIGRSDDDATSRYEDYYPRSRTGLGGLSLSAAGSSQVWRKDLSQTFAPLYIDPRTNSASVKVAVRVPDDAFPSIQNAPGEMISFTYYVECIIDIHGKLAASDLVRPNLSVTETIMNSESTGAEQQMEQAVTAWGTSCIDTSQIRREKSAITCLCDLVVGTKDSAKKGKKTLHSLQQAYAGALESEVAASNASRDHWNEWDQYYQGQDAYYHGHSNYGNEPYDYDYGYQNSQEYYYDPYGHPQPWYPSSNGQNMYIPPLPAEDESQLPEKERLRRAEARLLPSQPPEIPGSSLGASASGQAPSAPYIPNGGYHDSTNNGHVESHEHSAAPSAPVAADIATPQIHLDDPVAPTHAPGPSRSVLPPSTHVHPTDDKQELERQRLEAQASAPDVGTSAPLGRQAEAEDDSAPSAPPAFTEEDAIIAYGPWAGQSSVGQSNRIANGGENLPRYER